MAVWHGRHWSDAIGFINFTLVQILVVISKRPKGLSKSFTYIGNVALNHAQKKCNP